MKFKKKAKRTLWTKSSYLFCRSSCGPYMGIVFFKWANPGLFFVYFLSFQVKHYSTNNKSMWKMSCPSSIWHRDSNPWPSEHESPPITTRPGLSPYMGIVTICSEIVEANFTVNPCSLLFQCESNPVGLLYFYFFWRGSLKNSKLTNANKDFCCNLSIFK